MATMWMASGEEDDCDEFDGFYMGDNISQIKNVFEENGVKDTNTFENQANEPESKPRTGFGSPPKKKTSDRLTKTNSRTDSRSQQTQQSTTYNKGPSRMITPSVDDLRTAAMKGNVEAVVEFLEQGIAVDVVFSKSGWTPLMYAASMSKPELMEVLLARGANASFHQDQFNVLMAGCSSAQKEDRVLKCVQLLLQAEVEINSYDRYHMSPLIYAAREGHSQVIELLLEKGAKLNKQDNRGWTALSWSISKQMKLAARKLLELKADPFILHSDGQSPADFAYNDNYQDLLSLMNDPRAQGEEIKTVPTGLVPSINRTPHNNSSFVTSSSMKHGELELFLSGLGLSTLIPLFHHHQIDFASFLRLTDHDLKQIGVEQVGVRKQILDGIHTVHTKDWEPSSLPQYNKRISYTQSLALMSNITCHLKYITSSVGYLNDQLTAHPGVLDSQDGFGPKALHQLSDDSLGKMQHLSKEVTTLKDKLQKVLVKSNFQPADQIVNPKKKLRRRVVWRRRILTICVFSAIVGVGVYYKDTLKDCGIDSISKLREIGSILKAS